MTMDISESLAPASEQLDAIELLAGPRIFTIESVSRGSLEQPVQVHFVGFPRPWRPSKGMRRVLAACWGTDASKWAGRRVELFYDPSVTFGRETPGGTRISRLSHIDGPKSIPQLVSQGRSAMFRVEPLADEPAAPNWADLTAAATTRDELAAIREQAKAAGVTNGKEIDAMLAARANALKAADEPAADPA